MPEPSLAVFLAPVFLGFEIAQLIAAEKLLGARRIKAGADPREGGPGEAASALWVLMLFAQTGWQLCLLADRATRVHAGCLLLVTLVGFTLRGNCALRRALVILTVEGALRAGLMVSMLVLAWRAL